jgi:hypothetical protein
MFMARCCRRFVVVGSRPSVYVAGDNGGTQWIKPQSLGNIRQLREVRHTGLKKSSRSPPASILEQSNVPKPAKSSAQRASKPSRRRSTRRSKTYLF